MDNHPTLLFHLDNCCYNRYLLTSKFHWYHIMVMCHFFFIKWPLTVFCAFSLRIVQLQIYISHALQPVGDIRWAGLNLTITEQLALGIYLPIILFVHLEIFLLACVEIRYNKCKFTTVIFGWGGHKIDRSWPLHPMVIVVVIIWNSTTFLLSWLLNPRKP